MFYSDIKINQYLEYFTSLRLTEDMCCVINITGFS